MTKMKLNDLKISTRLLLGSALVFTLLLIAAAVGIARIERIQERMKAMTNAGNVEAQLTSRMRHGVMELMTGVDNVVMLSDAAAKQPEAERIRAGLEHYAQAQRKLQDMLPSNGTTTAEHRALLAKISERSAAAAPIFAKATELGLAGRNDEAIQVLMQELRPVQTQWQSALEELIGFEEKLNEQELVNIDRDYHNSRALIVSLVLLIVMFGGFVSRFIARGITGPIEEAVHVAETVASGDLTSKIEVTSADETGRLLAALRDMNASLGRIVSDVRSGTDTVATASGQIAEGNLDLSARTETQASSLEETASSMEELTSTVKQNADNARQASQLAATVSEVAIKGGEVVAQVVSTMDAIHASSKKIVDIIAVIDGIAFQTNILALNAAVEAARAGEQGRGFAVVAGEVRTLAQRSANAAKEIKTLIDDSVANVDVGNELVAEAGTTMSKVVASVKQMTDLVNEIALASQEQSVGIEQVNQAVGHMDEVTQQNAALVEEATAAAASLNDQARHLSQAVSAFRIIESQSRQPVVAVPAARIALALT
jgi:methyl-accepting chemotaxis protein